LGQEYRTGPIIPDAITDPDPLAPDWMGLPPGQADRCHGGRCYGMLRHCVKLCEPGYAVEFGTQTGHSLALIAQRLHAVGFDSFRGIPEAWGPFPKGAFAWDALPVIPNTTLIVGYYADTVPLFNFGAVQPLRLVHFDCDLYSSTKTVLEHLGPYLVPGVYVVFDEFGDFDKIETGDDVYGNNHEGLAWYEFAVRSRISWDIVGLGQSGAWAIRITDNAQAR
jgi:hypothetical protein